MSLATLVFLLATASITLTRCQEPEISDRSLDVSPPPIKLDKNLRRALLKALTDLETESAEQHKDESDTIVQRDTSTFEGVAKKNLNDDLGVQKFSFKSFPSEDDVPSEDKLQNSSFDQAVRYVTLKTPAMNIEKATQEDARSFHVHNVIQPVKSTASFGDKTESKSEQKEKTSSATLKTFSVSKVESVTLRPLTEISESLTGSATNGFASANALITQNPKITTASALVSPKPTASTVTASARTNATISSSSDAKDKTEEVKIFQAPLVAAFTVQQDEQGVPKSVVPIFKSPNDEQALTLQEQLDFKQKLLEKQLADLQQQQIQQTQFLVRQQQLYEQQLRQKQQQQQYYFQEQARIKQIEEQTRLKRLEEQRIKQLEEQRLKFEEQKLNRFQAQRPVPQKQFFFDQNNNFLTLQPPSDSNVHLQPSLALEVPNAAAPPAFQPPFQQEQARLQQFRPLAQQQLPQQQIQPLPHLQQSQQRLQPFQQLQQPQQLQQLQQPQQLQQLQQPQQLQHLQLPQPQQQRLQQSFGSFSNEFQPPLTSTSRFNRQEAFNSVGNFGFNADNRIRSNFDFNTQQRTPANFFNPFTQFRQAKPPTPARQIQHLLYQSGIAGELNNVPGIGNQEDLNIVSKVLALNVGAVPNKNLQFATNQASFGKASA